MGNHMKVQMLESRFINGRSVLSGETVELDDSKGSFLIARKEAKLAKEAPQTKALEPTKKTAQTKTDEVNV